MTFRRLGWLLGMAMTAPACADDNGSGTVIFTTWGEELIEQGLGTDVFPKDHWSVKYTRFLLALRKIEVADQDGKVGASLVTPQVFDMTQAGDKVIATYSLEAKSWPNVSYQLGPITADAVPGQLATQVDVSTMVTEGASIHVEGTATGPTGVLKTFNWSFPKPTLYEGCHGDQDGKDIDGVVVTNGGTQRVQLTIHGDHLFYDDLQSEEAVPRFQAIADADADGDGVVTLAELDAVPLYTIPAELGSYGTGALGNINTLGDYTRLLARNFGHYRGEGSCNAKDVASGD